MVVEFVVVSGEAGIDKTRLLEELSDLAGARGCLTLEGRAAEFERDLPFGLLTDALDDYLKSLDANALNRLATDRLGALAVVFPASRSSTAASTTTLGLSGSRAGDQDGRAPPSRPTS